MKGSSPDPDPGGGALVGNAVARRLHGGDIGGARVLRGFSSRGRYLRAGDVLTADEVRAIPLDNLRALIDNRQLDPFPASPPASEEARTQIQAQAERIRELEARLAGTERYAVHRGRGLYDVILGWKLNAEPLAEEDAKALAA